MGTLILVNIQTFSTQTTLLLSQTPTYIVLLIPILDNVFIALLLLGNGQWTELFTGLSIKLCHVEIALIAEHLVLEVPEVVATRNTM